MSIDERGIARLEKLSFDPYNEQDVLITAIENYRKRTGHYPQRVLVDQIYRNQKNRAYCKSRKIRISGKALGRPKKNPTSEEKKIAHQDNTDRIEVERGFKRIPLPKKRKLHIRITRIVLKSREGSCLIK